MQLAPLKYFESLYPENTREKEIREYLDFLKKGLSAQIIGIPGTGKNNLLRLLAYNIHARTYHFKEFEKYIHFVYIDSAEAKGRGQIDIIKLILYSLTLSLGERNMLSEASYVKNLLEEGLSLNDEFLMFQYLKKAIDFLTIEKKLSVILLFDRFDSIIPDLTEEFFSNLKSLRNLAKYRFGVIFALKRPLDESVDLKILSDFSDIASGNEVYIGINDPAGIDFRTNYIEKAARNKIDPKIRTEIINLTNGHAKLTKLAFEKMVTEDKKVENVGDYLLSQDSIKKALNEIWESLMPGEKTALKENLAYDELFTSHPYLIKSGLVDKNGVTIPLFKDYLNSITIENNEKITYDADHNDILKGNTSITKILSSSEFKLLKFLIENKNKVLSKDEIINAIWTDQKTQEGVTDQALDQIFYRLRKKVETNPSNPKFIETIKGTGYKFAD